MCVQPGCLNGDLRKRHAQCERGQIVVLGRSLASAHLWLPLRLCIGPCALLPVCARVPVGNTATFGPYKLKSAGVHSTKRAGGHFFSAFFSIVFVARARTHATRLAGALFFFSFLSSVCQSQNPTSFALPSARVRPHTGYRAGEYSRGASVALRQQPLVLGIAQLAPHIGVDVDSADVRVGFVSLG